MLSTKTSSATLKRCVMNDPESKLKDVLVGLEYVVKMGCHHENGKPCPICYIKTLLQNAKQKDSTNVHP